VCVCVFVCVFRTTEQEFLPESTTYCRLIHAEPK